MRKKKAYFVLSFHYYIHNCNNCVCTRNTTGLAEIQPRGAPGTVLQEHGIQGKHTIATAFMYERGPLPNSPLPLSHFIEQVQPEHGTTAARAAARAATPTATCSQILGQWGSGGSLNHQLPSTCFWVTVYGGGLCVVATARRQHGPSCRGLTKQFMAQPISSWNWPWLRPGLSE